jgi:hypothetical protein
MEFLSGVFVGVFALAWWQICLEVLLFGVFTICVFNELTEISSILIALGIASLAYFGIVTLRVESILGLLTYAGIYLVIGCVWSLFKYKQEATRIAEENLREYPGRTPEQTLNDIKYAIRNSRIAFWIVYFPISVIKFCLSDFVDYIISKLGIVYKSIAKAVVGSVYKDFKPEVKEKSSSQR